MNEIARATVENRLFVERNKAREARDGAIKRGKTEQYIQMWDDIGKLYDELFKQVESMKHIEE